MKIPSTKTLIIKIGATGDVVRTTPLLHAIEGELHWLTSEYNSAILPTDCSKLTNVFTIEGGVSNFTSRCYDMVLSLDEDESLADILPKLNYKRLAGIHYTDGKACYTRESGEWFEMSLLSASGKDNADRLKFANRKTYQEMIFEIAGQRFNTEPYWINLPFTRRKTAYTIGIEKRVGKRWSGKAWWGYDSLATQLQAHGYNVHFFSECSTLNEYMADIGSCDIIITGDTLAMHIAIALKLPTLAIFTCTSPWEIYDYGCLQKIVSPHLDKSFYRQEPVREAIESVTVEMVFESFSAITAEVNRSGRLW